jgi:hypothetical protein
MSKSLYLSDATGDKRNSGGTRVGVERSDNLYSFDKPLLKR